MVMSRLGPGRWLNAQLRLLSWLGEDLHGDSFLAEQRPQGRAVHVKILHSEACRTPAFLDRFRRCAERAMALSHRHAAAIHAFGVLPAQAEAAAVGGHRDLLRGAAPPSPRLVGAMAVGTPWIAMDPIEGPDLRSYLLDGLSPGALATLLLPIADVLDRAAALGLEHGELQPSSLIIVNEDPAKVRAVLLDLGLAKVVADNPLDVPLAPGSLCYRSPEQCVSGKNADPAGDCYALATILYEGVAGRPPFQAQSAQEILRLHRQAPVPPLRTLVPSLHRAQALDAFFVRALAKQPEARFPTATAMVEEFIIALGLPQKSDSRIPQRRRSSRWYRLVRHGTGGIGGRTVDVVVGPRAVLGKQPECDVVCHGMPSPDHDVITAGISREHAVLIWLDDRLSVLDQSCNGTYVNDRRAGPRLTPVPDGALLRMGEHLCLQVDLLAPPAMETAEVEAAPEVPGALLTRRDSYAAGVPPALMLWNRISLEGSPLAVLQGAMQGGQVWVAQRELFYSGHPSVNWQRQDGMTVMGPAPLRHGDTLVDAAGLLTVEH